MSQTQSPVTIDPQLPRVAGSRSLFGNFDACDHGYELSGWLFDAARPDRACAVQVRVDGKPLIQVEANVERPDLRPFGIRLSCGYWITLPASMFDGKIHEIELFALPENVRLGNPQPLAGIILDHKPYPKQFSVDSILKLVDGSIDYDRVFPREFLAVHGVRAAVAYAYLWLLKRPVDRSGWDAYSERVLSNEITLGDMLRGLAESEESQRAQRTGVNELAEFSRILRAAAKLPA
jgi:hypothetical protein